VSKRIGIGIIILIIIILIIGIGNQSPRKPIEPLPQINIATMPHSFSGYTIFLASKKGYFKDQGLDVTLIKTFPHGMATLNALDTGEAQIAASSETPFINSILKGSKLFIIATTITADEHLAIVARKDSLILNPKDLKNKRIGVTIGSNGEYFLDMVLNLNDLSRENIQLLNLKPNQMVETLLAKEVDAIATWNPQKTKAIKELGKNAVTFNAQNLYSPLFIVATTQDFATSNPEIIKKILKALLSATQFIETNPDESHKIVAKQIMTDPNLLNELTASYHFKLSLEQSFLTTLENQAYWALKGNYGSGKEMPNFLNYIYPEALYEINPGSVTIIR
jgi:ABC-type nitrate/sulfonate/bicarbonate transport system substrate-binding protein